MKQRACPTAQLMLPEDFDKPTKRTNARAGPGSTCTRGRRKVIGGDREIMSSKRTSVFPDPPIFDLTFRREGKVKQEESRKGDFDPVGRGLKCA